MPLVCLTKKYKYYECKQKSKIKYVMGENLKKAIVLAMLAVAVMGISATAQDPCAGCIKASGASAGSGGVDIVGAIFEAGDEGFNFPLDGSKDTNFDSIVVGDDIAKAFGSPFLRMDPQATARNSLEIKKNQDTQCSCCDLLENESPLCIDCCPVNNLEKIKVGNRNAFAAGDALASNDVKILTNQM